MASGRGPGSTQGGVSRGAGGELQGWRGDQRIFLKLRQLHHQTNLIEYTQPGPWNPQRGPWACPFQLAHPGQPNDFLVTLRK